MTNPATEPLGGKRKLLLWAETPEQRHELESLVGRDDPRWTLLPTYKTGEGLLELVQAQHADAVIFNSRREVPAAVDSMSLLAVKAPTVQRVVLAAPVVRELLKKLSGIPPLVLPEETQGAELNDRLASLFIVHQWLQRPELRSTLPLIKSLPALPAIYQRVFEALLDPDFSWEEIARIISQDPPLTAQLLKVVNSVFFGLSHPVQTVKEAVLVLGESRVKAIIMSSQAFCFLDEGVCPGFSPSEEWDHALLVGQSGQELARKGGASVEAAEAVFTAGVLHDLGKLLLAANFPDRYAALLMESRGRGLELWKLEQNHLGIHHGELGACLLAVWGLPLPIVAAVAWHHEPRRAPLKDPLAHTCVHLADALSRNTSPDMDWIREAGLERLVP